MGLKMRGERWTCPSYASHRTFQPAKEQIQRQSVRERRDTSVASHAFKFIKDLVLKIRLLRASLVTLPCITVGTPRGCKDRPVTIIAKPRRTFR